MRTDPGHGRWVPAVAALAGLGLLASLAGGCRSAAPLPALTAAELREARSALSGPLPGDFAALYRLRVPSSGGLRFSVLAMAGRGRITISEPFGSALSLTAWEGSAPPVVFDMREGCRFTTDDLSGVLGVADLPLPEAVHLLAGRLPAVAGDDVRVLPDGGLGVVTPSWEGVVSVAPDPWRVTEVQDATGGGSQWRLSLRDHRLAVPGWLKVWAADGRWAELELIRLQWNRISELPGLPDVPVCAPAGRRSAIADPKGN